MKKILLLILTSLVIASNAYAGTDCVILLHGLARTNHSMTRMADYLQAHHYTVVNQSYPTTKKTINTLAEETIPEMVNACLKQQPDHIYFVTHSLGGIVLRNYLEHHSIPKLSRIVMLGPPNHGSPLADMLHDNILFQTFTGPSGQELTTTKTSTPNKLKASLPYQVGIIAGDSSPIGQMVFHEKNDGKVSVSSTKLTGMRDFIVLPVSHTFMMRNPLVMMQVLQFIEHGQFTHHAQHHVV